MNLGSLFQAEASFIFLPTTFTVQYSSHSCLLSLSSCTSERATVNIASWTPTPPPLETRHGSLTLTQQLGGYCSFQQALSNPKQIVIILVPKCLNTACVFSVRYVDNSNWLAEWMGSLKPLEPRATLTFHP